MFARKFAAFVFAAAIPFFMAEVGFSAPAAYGAEPHVFTTNASTGSCGVWRWSVKTGTDQDAGLVNLNSVTSATIAGLGALPTPSSYPSNSRIQPTETTVFAVNATLTQYKLEGDSDYHMVLSDGNGHTMIAEIPDPSCVGGSSPFLSDIQTARQVFDNHYTATTSFQNANVPVCITGVGFFDEIHGQNGVAPNGVEIHPVLNVVFNPSSCGGSSGGGGGNAVPVASNGSVSTTENTAVSGTLSASDTDGDTLAFAAVSKPSHGMASITNASTGAFTYTPASNYTGSDSFTFKATDSAGQVSNTATESVTVNASGGGTQVLGNPGFENGSSDPAPWAASSNVIYGGSTEPPHAGQWDAWLDGYGSAHTDTLSQQVSLPSTATQAVLGYWLHVDTDETTTSHAYDTLKVQLYDASGNLLQTLATYSNLNAASGYGEHTVDLGAYIGKTVTLKFTGSEDYEKQTSFVLDDVHVNVQ